MSNKKIELPAALQLLFDALKTGKDTPIATIHATLFGSTLEDPRSMQQRVGPYVTRLNRRIRGAKKIVKPGALKGTYVLTSIS